MSPQSDKPTRRSPGWSRRRPDSENQFGNLGPSVALPTPALERGADMSEKAFQVYASPGTEPTSVQALISEPSATRRIEQAASDIIEIANEAAKTAVDAVSAQASELASNVADELNTSAEEQKKRGADTMRGFAKAIRTAANQLGKDSPQIARGFHSAAEAVESLSDNLRDKRIRDLFHTTTQVARVQPIVFFAGALFAGFILARFLKSSSEK